MEPEENCANIPWGVQGAAMSKRHHEGHESEVGKEKKPVQSA